MLVVVVVDVVDVVVDVFAFGSEKLLFSLSTACEAAAALADALKVDVNIVAAQSVW